MTPTSFSATFTDANQRQLPRADDFLGHDQLPGDSSTTAFTSSAVTGSGGSYTVSGSHQYAEEGSKSITVTIKDVGGSSTTDSGTTSVSDAALTAGTVTATGGVEGETATSFSATFTDGNHAAPTSDFSGTNSGGDSSTTAFTSGAVTANGGGSFTISGFTHQYAEEGSKSITVTIKDLGGSSTTDSGTTSVSDAALAAGTVTATAGMTATSLSATFTDGNHNAPTSDFSGTINWGDSSTSSFTSSAVSGSGGSYTVSGSHQYAGPGSFPITVSINDDGGSSTTDSGEAYVGPLPNPTITPTASGYLFTFSRPINQSLVHLYDGQHGPTNVNWVSPPTTGGAAQQAAEACVVVTGPSGKTITGSLVWISSTQAEWINTGSYDSSSNATGDLGDGNNALMAPGNYAVTLYSLTSGVNGYYDPSGNGLASGHYGQTFTVANGAATTALNTSLPVVSVPNFARGPGQAVNVTPQGTTGDGSAAGLPVLISNSPAATNVGAVSLDLTYSTAYMTVASYVTGGPGTSPVALSSYMQANYPDWVIGAINTLTPGQVIVDLYDQTSGSEPLSDNTTSLRSNC